MNVSSLETSIFGRIVEALDVPLTSVDFSRFLLAVASARSSSSPDCTDRYYNVEEHCM